jgi:alpha-glucoside transport system substrate-binding protein
MEVEPGLVAAMVADVADRPAALPLLQYALTELAEQEGRALTIDGYRRIGGVSGALARRAEALFQQLDETGRHACRRLFLRLVRLGDGTESTRRRVRRSELRSLADDRSTDAVIETFGRHRLLSFDRDPESREPTVEIAHEALIAGWGRLRDWIEDSRDDLRLHARISAASIGWVGGGRSEDDLLSGVRLAEAESTVANDLIALSDGEREYVGASVDKRDAAVAADRARQEREVRLERRSVRRLRSLVAVLAVASILSGSLAIIAVDRGHRAERAVRQEQVDALTLGSIATLRSDPELSVALALHAVDIAARPPALTVTARTIEALHFAIEEAGIPYPTNGSPAVVPGTVGPRGIVEVPLADLVELARSHLSRKLTPSECRAYLGTSTCPALSTTLPENVPLEPIQSLAPADSTRPLAGTTVKLVMPLFAEPWPTDLTVVLDEFRERTGIDIQYSPGPDDIVSFVDQSVARGEPPDLVLIPQPTEVATWAQAGALADLSRYLDVEKLRAEQSPYLVSLGTVGLDGSSPAAEGGLYGAFVDLSAKSLIWYPAAAFREAGYRVPRTWADLLALSDQLVQDGRTPWCIGWQAGDASGWPGTDWIENLVLADAGPEAYDQWMLHEIPFQSSTLRDAFARLGQILFRDGYVFGGINGAAANYLDQGLFSLAEEDPPGCWLDQAGAFMAPLLPPEDLGSTVDVAPFPTIDPDANGALIGGGMMVAAFSDRPEVREAVRFLLSAEYGAQRAALGDGYIPANLNFELDTFPAQFDRHEAEMIRHALAADTFRFDASDLMPPEIGTDLFWRSMMRYLEEGPASLAAILAELDAAWPDDR